MSKIIGIDLGTTNSCVSILEASVPKVIENAEGARTTPSVVAYADDDQVLVGISAKRQAVANPKNTLYAIKRLIGRRFGDAEVKKESELAPYSIVEAKNGDAWVEVSDKKISPPEVSALVLRKLRSAAEDYLGESVSEAVITVPAYFNDSQRQATKDAGKIAGLDVKRIINEPTAAAMAFGIDKKGKDRKVAVYDLGGGTFDVSIIEIVSVDGDTQFEVLATNGDTFLGGEDFDQLVIDYLISEFKQSSGIDLSSDVLALQRLKEAAEKAKIELSSNTQTDINLPYVTADSSGPKHMNIKLTRAKLESLVDHLIDRTFEPCKTALKDAKITGKVDDVILVGGMTRMPYVQQKAQEIFGIEPRHDINPDEAVASGAAIQAAVLQGDVKDVLLLDVTPLSLGIETEGSVMTKLIEKNTTIPTKASKMFSTAADNQSAVTVHVLQGEREQAQYNKSLGMFNLSDILPARRGEPQIEVAFDIDANGILHVTATDRRTGKDAKIQVTASSGLSEDEINRMVKDAEEHAEEDRKFADLTKLRNLAEAHCNAIRKQISEHGKDLSEQENANIQDAISAVEQAVKGDDTEAINAAITKLGEASTPLHEKAQASASSEENANPEGSDAAGSKDSSSDESDAEVEVVRKDDNEKKDS